MKKTLRRCLVLIGAVFPTGVLFAQNAQFAILPESKTSTQELSELILKVSKTWGLVNDTYTMIADELSVEDQLATGIMNWDTLFNYVVYLIKFLSQIGMLIGTIMLIYAGYQYATQIFWGEPKKGSNAVKNALLGIIVITFSYAIMKAFTAMFRGT